MKAIDLKKIFNDIPDDIIVLFDDKPITIVDIKHYTKQTIWEANDPVKELSVHCVSLNIHVA